MNISPDLFNGCFELFGSVMLWLNVRRLYIDKTTKGINGLTVIFFTSWGFWNLYFYQNLDQPFSFYGGISMVFANTVWLLLMMYYKRNSNDNRLG